MISPSKYDNKRARLGTKFLLIFLSSLKADPPPPPPPPLHVSQWNCRSASEGNTSCLTVCLSVGGGSPCQHVAWKCTKQSKNLYHVPSFFWSSAPCLCRVCLFSPSPSLVATAAVARLSSPPEEWTACLCLVNHTTYFAYYSSSPSIYHRDT